MTDLPDHPDVAHILRSGEPPGVWSWDPPRCPVCGEEAEEIYSDMHGVEFACDGCVRIKRQY